MFSFSRYCHSFPKCLYQFTLLLIGYESFSFSVFFSVLMIISLCCYSHACDCVLVLICIFPMTNEIKIFLYAYCLLDVFCLVAIQIFCQFFYQVVFLLLICRRVFFYVCSEYESSIEYMYCQYLLLLTWLYKLLKVPDTKFNVVP